MHGDCFYGCVGHGNDEMLCSVMCRGRIDQRPVNIGVEGSTEKLYGWEKL